MRMRTLLVAGAAALLGACGSDELNVDPNFASIQSEVFNKTCLDSGCHNASDAAAAGELNLESGSAYDDLVGVPAVQSRAANEGLDRVDPGSATDSLLYQKLIGTTYGTRMPQGKKPLPDSAVQAIQEWIENGAAR